jgi:serine/threonine protein kinase
MLTGYLPFKGSTAMATYMKHIKEQPKPPSQLNPAITYPIEQVILRAIEKDPQRRYPTAQALAEAYAQALVATKQLQHEATTLVPQSLNLSSSSQRIIKLPSPHAARRLHLAYGIVVAAMLLLMLPLSLGFFAFNHDMPAAIGASIQLPSGIGTLHEKPPFARPTVQTAAHPQSTAHPQNELNNGTRQSNSSGGQGNQGNQSGKGHGHRHGHDHGHRHGD